MKWLKENWREALVYVALATFAGGLCTVLGVSVWKSSACRDEREVLADMKEAKRDFERKTEDRRHQISMCMVRRYDYDLRKLVGPSAEDCAQEILAVDEVLAKLKVVQQ